MAPEPKAGGAEEVWRKTEFGESVAYVLRSLGRSPEANGYIYFQPEAEAGAGDVVVTLPRFSSGASTILTRALT